MRGVVTFFFVVFSTFASAKSIIVQLASGQTHHCARFSDGRLRCWGLNNFGQVGFAKDENDLWLTDPLALPNLDLPPVIDVALGEHHTCAILEDRSVRCWGENLQGQLGPQYNGPNLPLPEEVIPAKLFLAAKGSCLVSESGEVWCWGYGTGEEVLAPRKIELPLPAKSVAMADDEYCALLINGDTQCFAPSYYVTPKNPFKGWQGKNIRTLQAGMYSLCALFQDNTVHCQGKTSFTLKGDEVDFGTGLPVEQFAFANNGHFACAIFSPTGTLKCMGDNSSGQLGDPERTALGTTVDNSGANLPFVDLGRHARARRMSLGFSNTCVQTGDRDVHCWGYGRYTFRPTNLEFSDPFHF